MYYLHIFLTCIKVVTYYGIFLNTVVFEYGNYSILILPSNATTASHLSATVIVFLLNLRDLIFVKMY